MPNRIRIAALLLGLAALQTAAYADTILFVGNSFTFGGGSPPVQGYRPETVTDLNREGMGGVPALFKSFTRQAGLPYDVSLETAPGMNLDFHYEQKAALIKRCREGHRIFGATRAVGPRRESAGRRAPGRDLVAG